VRSVPRLCALYPVIFLTTEEKARKNLSEGSNADLTRRHTTIHRRKRLTQSNTILQNNKGHRIDNREDSLIKVINSV
jgi:hypothetical protein